MTHPVLIVEDDISQSRSLARFLGRRMGLDALQAENGRIALNYLRGDEGSGKIKLVIMDVNMPVMGGMEALGIIRQRYPLLPVIMLTAGDNVEDAVESMRLGASDFLVKPYDAQRLEVTVSNALKLGVLTKEVNRLQNHRGAAVKFSDLVGYDAGLLSSVALGRKAAACDIALLVTGETGTGKEVFARAVHGEGLRSGRPFIAVNCGAIPAQLVESTLFGHEKGAFTGAFGSSPGKFREADGGTIFLDEVGELPMEAQVKLLRVLQQGEVEPVGASKSFVVDVRIISATNRDIAKMVENGEFREDLYYRLNVFPVHLPPLRERREDIMSLANHFVERFCSREGCAHKSISFEMEKELMEADWSGNVRELENIISRAMVVGEDGALRPGHGLKNNKLNDELNVVSEDMGADSIRVVSSGGQVKKMEEVEAETMEIALKYCGGNITKASGALGMAKSTFYRKINKYFPDYFSP